MKKIILLNIFYFSICTVAVKSAEKGGMPQLNPEFWVSQIFWLTITFGTLFLVLSKFILPRISKNLEQRRLQILTQSFLPLIVTLHTFFIHFHFHKN